MTADMTVTYLLAYLLACGSNKSLKTINGENENDCTALHENENENGKKLFPRKTTENTPYVSYVRRRRAERGRSFQSKKKEIPCIAVFMRSRGSENTWK